MSYTRPKLDSSYMYPTECETGQEGIRIDYFPKKENDCMPDFIPDSLLDVLLAAMQEDHTDELEQRIKHGQFLLKFLRKKKIKTALKFGNFWEWSDKYWK